MIKLRPANERGHVQWGWLDSHHSFSFGNYFDPRHMGFSHLRVINEDRVDPGAGFPPHGHRDMEIISYPVAGALAHRDSTGSGGTIRAGEVQLMRAGRGIRHSEMNASQDEAVHFLQIWIQPAERGTDPGYQQRDFGREEGVQLLASPDGREESLQLGQDADLHRLILPPGGQAQLSPQRPRGWVQVVSGSAHLNGTDLAAGDGAALTDERSLRFVAGPAGLEALVFDLR